MTLVQLRQFVVLARAGSFLRAAQQLHITQPALSRSIKALEDDLGSLLFDRVGRRIELTPFGRSTLQRAQSLLDDAAQLRADGGELGKDDQGSVRIGLSSGPGRLLGVPILRHVARHLPRYRVALARGHTETLVSLLRDGALDAIIVDIRYLKPASDLHVQQQVQTKGAVLCRAGHPLLKKRRVTFNDLLGYPVVSTPLSDELARILVEHYGERAHPDTLVRLESDEISTLVELAETTDAVLLAVRAAAPQLRELPVDAAFHTFARYGLVTLARRSEDRFLPVLRTVMTQVFAGPSPA